MERSYQLPLSFFFPTDLSLAVPLNSVIPSSMKIFSFGKDVINVSINVSERPFTDRDFHKWKMHAVFDELLEK